jgi:hypothetical protein
MAFNRLELRMQRADSGGPFPFTEAGTGSLVARQNSYGSGGNPRQQRATIGKLLSRLVPSVLFCALGIFFGSLHAQEKVHLATGPLSDADKALRLEVETVSVSRFGALPNSIHRHPGKFILVVLNKSGNPQQSFTLEPVAPGNAPPSGNPPMRLGGLTARNGKAAGLIDAPIGQFQLKSATTGNVLCQITIE